jgi:hypothetical protein
VTGKGKNGGAKRPAKGVKPSGQGTPDWTKSLRQLYDSVVDEPLPDNFKNLLDKLDKK